MEMQLTQTQIDYCMECGVCTGSCPVSRQIFTFSPRQMIKRSLVQARSELLQSHDLWACLSCARCSERCPVEIDFPEFIRQYREEARKVDNLPVESHHGVLQSISELQTRQIVQKRTAWAAEAGQFAETGDIFYFVGCLPFFDVTFRYLDVPSLDIARSVLKLLNRLGVEPVISNDERCCGHDALWSGNEALFLRLANANMEAIRRSGAKTVLFACPEGYQAFKTYYPQYFGELPFEVLHITEYLMRELPAAGISLQPSGNGAVTFQDPCRLGRWLGMYDPPRELLQMVPDVNLREMERNRENALCCGTTAWMECSACSKGMQIERLQEALDTGANTLITACPKCQIHLTCAQSGTDLNLNVVDLYKFLADRLADA